MTNAKLTPAARPLAKTKGQRLAKEIRRNWELYMFLIPSAFILILFSYVPMYGLIMAFQNAKAGAILGQSEWVGLYQFQKFFTGMYFGTTVKNTVTVAFTSSLLYWPSALFLALLLHNSTNTHIKKAAQSLTYVPHLLSTVLIFSILTLFVEKHSGLINIFRSTVLGLDKIDFFLLDEAVIPMYIITGIWQNTGYNAIVYLGALSAVDEGLVEAARIDGASKLRIIWDIQLPTILPTIVTMLILNMGHLFSVGTDKMLLLQTDFNLEASEIIGTYTYKMGVQQMNYGFSTAVGLFNNVVNVIMMFIFNWLGDKFAGQSIV